jgi:hypothetical protein
MCCSTHHASPTDSSLPFAYNTLDLVVEGLDLPVIADSPAFLTGWPSPSDPSVAKMRTTSSIRLVLFQSPAISFLFLASSFLTPVPK